MKKLVLTLGIFLAGIFFVNAQDKAVSKMMDKLTQVAQLTPEQVNKVQPIVANYVNARKANKQQYASDQASLKAANKTTNENYKAQLKSVLAPGQMEKLKAYKAQHKADRKGGQEEEQE